MRLSCWSVAVCAGLSHWLLSPLPAADPPAGTPPAAVTPSAPLEFVRVSRDGSHFVVGEQDQRFFVWGVNYDHDGAGRLLEDYWDAEWDTVVEDFREIRALGANCVRIHLQLGRFMQSADQPHDANLQQLARLIRLAEETRLYLDITGLGCYHKQDVPAWYDALSEAERWKVQARFWTAVATVGRDSPAVFCYDLMNEPVIGGDPAKDGWLAGEALGDKYFVQRIAIDLAGRKREDVAKAWVAQLTSAIREVDQRHLLTVGVIPWAHVWKNAKPLFHSPEVGQPLDFVAVHFYPKGGDVEGSLAALKVYELGKPLVVEEIFPLGCSLEEAGQFIDQSRPFVDGFVSFYWGRTIEENEKSGELTGAIIAQWLRYFRDHAPGATPAAAR